MSSKKNIDVLFISTLNPDSHVSRYLIENFRLVKDLKIAYVHENEEIIDFPKINVIGKFDKNLLSIFQILKLIFVYRPKIVHFQHELNMYGGLLSAIFFPILLIFSRLLKLKVITTIHAYIPKKTLNKDFVKSMMPGLKKTPLFLIRIFFYILMKSICFFSTKVVVHTPYIKSLLNTELNINKTKIVLSFLGSLNYKKIYKPKNFYFHFGYVTPRKDLEKAIIDFNIFNKSHKKFKFYISGKPLNENDQYFLDLKNRFSSKYVIFVGFIDKKLYEYYFKYCRAVILPDKYSIAGSGPLAMAFTYNKIPITYNVGNFKYTIKNNINGFKVKNSWKNHFNLLSSDEKALKIQKTIYLYKQKYTWKLASEIHLNLYSKLISSYQFQ